MKCINCGHEWQAEEQKIVTCPTCGLEAEYVKDDNSYDKGVLAEREGKLKEAIHHYRLAAEDHVPCAAVALYRSLVASEGEGEESLFWLQVGADEGDPIACYLLSLHYRKRRRQELFRFYLLRSARAGYESAVMRLAKLYRREGNRPAARLALTLLPRAGVSAKLYARLYLKKGEVAQTLPSPLPPEPSFYMEMAKEAEGRELPHIAYLYYTLAAPLPEALIRRATYDMKGMGDGRPLSDTYSDLLEAGEAGLTDAYLLAAGVYLKGRSEPEPDEKERILRALRLGGEAGNPRAIKYLADAYFEGKLCEIHLERALYWYRLAAEGGDAEAEARVEQIQRALLATYENARAAAAQGDVDTAAALYAKCAEMGHTPSYFALGQCHERAEGCKKNYRVAAALYQKAIEGGSVEALYALGMLYATGRGVPFSFDKATGLLSIAAARGYAEAGRQVEALKAARRRALCRQTVSRGCTVLYKGDVGGAMRLFAKAAGEGDGEALYYVGLLAEFGTARYGDGLALADESYARSAAAGFTDKSRIKAGVLRLLAKVKK